MPGSRWPSRLSHAFNTKVNIGTALDNLYLSANPYDLSFNETAS